MVEWIQSSADCDDLVDDHKSQLLGERGKILSPGGSKGQEGRLDCSKFNDKELDLLYSTLNTYLRAGKVVSAQTFCQEVEIRSLRNILNGGTPFMDLDLYRKLGEGLKKPYNLRQAHLLDYMKNLDLLEFRSKKCIGNHNWLLWLRTAHLASINSTSLAEKEFYALLCSNYEICDQSCLTIMERLTCLLRVIFFI